jgi:hypothetical protein
LHQFVSDKHYYFRRYATGTKFEKNWSNSTWCLWRNWSWQVEISILIYSSYPPWSGLTVLAVPFLTPALRRHALPYVPATRQQLDNIFNLLKQYSTAPRRHLIDLGSGDGRIVNGLEII